MRPSGWGSGAGKEQGLRDKAERLGEASPASSYAVSWRAARLGCRAPRGKAAEGLPHSIERVFFLFSCVPDSPFPLRVLRVLRGKLSPPQEAQAAGPPILTSNVRVPALRLEPRGRPGGPSLPRDHLARLLPPPRSRAGSSRMARTRAKAASTSTASSRKGRVNSQTSGNKSTTSNANGQHRTNRSAQPTSRHSTFMWATPRRPPRSFRILVPNHPRPPGRRSPRQSRFAWRSASDGSVRFPPGSDCPGFWTPAFPAGR